MRACLSSWPGCRCAMHSELDAWGKVFGCGAVCEEGLVRSQLHEKDTCQQTGGWHAKASLGEDVQHIWAHIRYSERATLELDAQRTISAGCLEPTMYCRSGTNGSPQKEKACQTTSLYPR